VVFVAAHLYRPSKRLDSNVNGANRRDGQRLEGQPHPRRTSQAPSLYNGRASLYNGRASLVHSIWTHRVRQRVNRRRGHKRADVRRGEAGFVFRRDDLTWGIAVCADVHNCEVFAACARPGAQVVFEVAAPGLYGEQATRDWRSGYEWWRGECWQYPSAYARDYGLWIAVATQAGRTVDEDFPGGGYLFRPGGGRAYETADGSEGLALVTARPRLA
jgi:predicted amidohydrolase